MELKKPGILNLSAEAKVGLFVLAGILILVYMSLRIGGISFGREEGYTLYVSFASASGLDKDASVRVAGVEIGKVKVIELRGNRAYLTLHIKPDVKLGKDFSAVLTTKGLLGEKYLELIPGSPNAPPLKDGDEITRTISYADMDKLMTILSDVAIDIKKVTETMSHVLGGPEGETTLKNIIKNIENISFRVDRLVAANDEKFGRIMSNLDEFTGMVKTDGPRISKELQDAVRSMNDAFTNTSANLNRLIDENRGDLKDGVANLKVAAVKLQEAMENINKLTKDVGPQVRETMDSLGSITSKINKGEGTLGKLINDPAIHDNLTKTIKGVNNYLDRAESIRTVVGFRSEFLADEKNTKSYFSLKIQPKADKYYLLEIIDDPRGKLKTEQHTITTSGGTSTTTDGVRTNTIKFSAQIAKRFKNVVVRGGIIESTGGAGIDYYMLSDRLRLSLEAFDFNQKTTNFGSKTNPHMKAGATVSLNKYFHLVAGYDDFINRKGVQSGYFGLGFQFDDEDLKYLLSSVPSAKSF